MSVEPFSPLEIQLVRASLSTKTTEEISQLLERSVEDVITLINEITGGKAEDRDRDVNLYLQEKAQVKGKKKRNPVAIALEKKRKAEEEAIKLDQRTSKSRDAERAWQTQRATYKKSEERRRYKTIDRDYSKMISVKLDDKTWAMVEIQKTKEETERLIAQTRATFEANKTLNQYKVNIT